MTEVAVSKDGVLADLQTLMKAHGVALDRHEGWLITGGGYPALRGAWHPQIGNQPTGRLDIQVVLDSERVIDECFAGVGDGQARYVDAMQNFSLGSLHVMRSALWGSRHEKVLTENWQSPTADWRAHVGEFVSRCLGPDEISFPANLLDILQNALMQADLQPGVHWLRTFYSNTGGGESLVEVLLDNRKWQSGEAAVAKAGWPSSNYYYSLRNFLILEHLG